MTEIEAVHEKGAFFGLFESQKKFPREKEEYMKGQLEAKDDHLQDMRRIVFDGKEAVE